MNADTYSGQHRPPAAAGWLLALLLAGGFTLATSLQLWFQNWSGNRLNAESLIDVLLGDSRRLFANHFFVEADVYLHAGYYPSIFDQVPARGKLKVAANDAHAEEDEKEHGKAGHEHHDEKDDLPDFMSTPKNWIERFGRNFYPTEHRHMESKKDVAEILPWLAMSAKLDPHRIETITVTAFWLRKHLGRVQEALDLLRVGLRDNPDNVEIMYELGLVYYDGFHDTVRARNLWEAALARWKEHAAKEDNPDRLMLGKILTFLADLEEKDGHPDMVLKYLEILKTTSPFRDTIQHRIDGLRKAQAANEKPSGSLAK
jgi:hypothetical protein